MGRLDNDRSKPYRKKLREWLYLEEILLAIHSAVAERDLDALVAHLGLYLSIAYGYSWDLESSSWLDLAVAFNDAIVANTVDSSKFPFTRAPVDTRINQIELEYPHKLWWNWAYSFASTFGWSLEYIADLDVEDAFSLLQEILINKQLEREWEWALSEKSVGYDSKTKKASFIELPRPDWMKVNQREGQKATKQVRMKKSMLPAGLVVRPTLENVES